MLRRASFFFALLAFFPLGVHAAGLDDYYLSRFNAHDGSHKQTALATAAPAVEGLAERCLTPLYHGLRRDWKSLSSETQKTLAKYVGKPALAGEKVFPSVGGHFNIHYATERKDEFVDDSPPLTDEYSNGVPGSNGIPDWVETVASVFEDVYQYETGVLGYDPAPTLFGAPYDVYLQNLAPVEFGHTNADPPLTPGSTSVTSYIVIDNDFTDPVYAPYTGITGLQITAAHEYHHAIQYGYNYYFDIWFAEATSTWIEDEVYDPINQLYDYLPGYMQNSKLSLDAPPPFSKVNGAGYGRWIFNRYLAEPERYGRDIIRSIWVRLATLSSPDGVNDIPMLPVIDDTLKSNGGNLGSDFLSFTKKLYVGDWTKDQERINSILADVSVPTYRNYPVNSESAPKPSVTLPHYAFAYFKFNPSASSPDPLVLTLSKHSGIAAVAFKKITGGDITEYQFDPATGRITIPGFNAAGIEVALLIANNSACDGQAANFSTDGTVSSLPANNCSSGGGGGGSGGGGGRLLHRHGRLRELPPSQGRHLAGVP